MRWSRFSLAARGPAVGLAALTAAALLPGAFTFSPAAAQPPGPGVPPVVTPGGGFLPPVDPLWPTTPVIPPGGTTPVIPPGPTTPVIPPGQNPTPPPTNPPPTNPPPTNPPPTNPPPTNPPPTNPPPGEGGPTQNYTVTVTAEKSEVLIGNTVTLTATVTGDDVGDISLAYWSWACPDRGDLSRYPLGSQRLDEGGRSTITDCQAMVGTKRYYCGVANDDGTIFEGTADVTILGPDKIVPRKGPADGTAFPLMRQPIYFELSRDGEPIGKDCCIDAEFQERGRGDLRIGEEGWQYGEWTPWPPPPGYDPTVFYFDCEENRGVDWKVYYLPIPDEWPIFRSKPQGSLLGYSLVQQVRVIIPTVCGGRRAYEAKPGWRIEPRKGPGDTVEWQHTPMPVEPAHDDL